MTMRSPSHISATSIATACRPRHCLLLKLLTNSFLASTSQVAVRMISAFSQSRFATHHFCVGAGTPPWISVAYKLPDQHSSLSISISPKCHQVTTTAPTTL